LSNVSKLNSKPLTLEFIRFDMEKGVEKILLDRQIAKDRGVLGAVNVAVWHRSVVYEPKKELEKKLPDRVAKKCVGACDCVFVRGIVVVT
jgi:hypothetical protein